MRKLKDPYIEWHIYKIDVVRNHKKFDKRKLKRLNRRLQNDLRKRINNLICKFDDLTSTVKETGNTFIKLADSLKEGDNND